MNYLPLAFLLIAVLSITMVEKANADTTFGYTTGTHLHLGTSTASGQNCGTIHGSDTSATLLELLQQSQFTGSCDSTWWRWDISSIPTNAVIKSASIKYDYTVINQPNANEKCQIRSQVVHDPITATISALWSQDQNSGNIIIDNDTACTGTSSGNTVSLPSSALTDIQNNLSAHWYAVVLKYAAVPNNRPAGSSYYATNSGNVQLQIVYSQDSLPPTASASPAGATYTSAQSVTLAASEPATIYYTKDGTTPTTSSAVYSSPISIGTSTTLKFYAKDTAGNTGPVVTQVYAIDTTPPTVSASPIGGTYTSTQSVTLTASRPSTIYYTTDGTTPTTSSTNGPNPVTGIVINNNSTLKFFAKDTLGNISPTVTQVYTIIPPPHYDGKKAVISINFEHALASQWSQINSNMSGMNASVAVIVQRMGHTGYMTAGQLHTLEKRGFEIVSHSETHLFITPDTPTSAICYEAVQSKIDLQKMGFKVYGMVPPYINVIPQNFATIVPTYSYTELLQTSLGQVNYNITYNTPQSINGSKQALGIYDVPTMGVGTGDQIQNFTSAKSIIDNAIAKKL